MWFQMMELPEAPKRPGETESLFKGAPHLRALAVLDRPKPVEDAAPPQPEPAEAREPIIRTQNPPSVRLSLRHLHPILVRSGDDSTVEKPSAAEPEPKRAMRETKARKPEPTIWSRLTGRF